MSSLIRRISNHSIFEPLFKEKKIIIVHKGSIAQRLVLLHHFPRHKQSIDQYFKYGGDNDCAVLVDPNLEQYDQIRSFLVSYIVSFMVEKVGSFSCGDVETRAKEITSITIGNLTLPVKPVSWNHFKIHSDGDVTFMDTAITKDSVFVSNNNALTFKDDAGRTTHFTLLRYKKAFQVGKAIVSAKLLDIAIPHKDDLKYLHDFHYYRSGMYTCEINI